MEDMAHDFHEKEEITAAKEFSFDFADMPPFLALICIAGVITNAALLYILTKIDLRNALNALLLSLTLSNLLFLVFFMPFDTVAIGSKSYPFSEALCKTTDTISTTCLFVWPFTLIAISAHRIIREPGGGRTPKVAIIVVWSLAFLLGLLSMGMAMRSVHGDDVPIVYCPIYEHSFYELKITVQLATVVAVPLVVVGCYLYDVVKRNRTANVPSREQRDISRLVLVLAAVYTICQIPSVILDVMFMFFYDKFTKYDNFYHSFNIAARFLYFLYPSACPVALFCASGSFRQLFKRHVLFWCKSSNQEPVVDCEVGMQPLVQPTPVPVTLTSG